MLLLLLLLVGVALQGLGCLDCRGFALPGWQCDPQSLSYLRKQQKRIVYGIGDHDWWLCIQQHPGGGGALDYLKQLVKLDYTDTMTDCGAGFMWTKVWMD